MEAADIVTATHGRDKGGRFFIIGFDGDFALLADGRGRRVERPKRKNPKHIQLVASEDSRIAVKLQNGEKITNSEVRRALAVFAGDDGVKGGMYTWRKTT